jgi:GR25 family glycosyltransferase involved in LPS biosynthesis
MLEIETYIENYIENASPDALVNYLRSNECYTLAIVVGEMYTLRQTPSVATADSEHRNSSAAKSSKSSKSRCRDGVDLVPAEYSACFLNELALAYYFDGQHTKSWQLYEILLTQNSLSEYMAQFYWFNAHFNIPHIMHNYLTYPSKIIQSIAELTKPNTFNLTRPSLPGARKPITFSITTCKRYDLFERTMNSFINCCRDLDLIGRWLCVDDNSSPEDRDKMLKNYPFFEFYFKGPFEKGHPQSMNIILRAVNTPYLFHMEDDWQFHHQNLFLTNCLEVLNSDNSLGQCLINKNYAEVESDVKILGGIFRQTQNGLRFFTHDFIEDSSNFQAKYGFGPNCAYWPHYSLRPGLNDVGKLKRVGKYREHVQHFEMEYAYRYAAMGFKTAFLPLISCSHIGRLTSERFTQGAENAYTLNNEEQFGAKPTPGLVVKVINMQNRGDRWTSFEAHNAAILAGLSYGRFEAINGYALAANRYLEQLFNNNDYNFRKGMIGCALSHIQLWIECSAVDNVYIILEDDVKLVDDFHEQVKLIVGDLSQADIIFLGHHEKNNNPEKNKESLRECLSFKESLEFSLGGTGGYLITPVGAQKMLAFVQHEQMPHGIDTMMQKACNNPDIRILYCNSHLFTTDCFHAGNPDTSIDTDIQRNYDNLCRSMDARINDEIEYFTRASVNVIIWNPNSSELSAQPGAVIIGPLSKSSTTECNYTIGKDIGVNIPLSVIEEHAYLGDYGLWDNTRKTYSLKNILSH